MVLSLGKQARFLLSTGAGLVLLAGCASAKLAPEEATRLHEGCDRLRARSTFESGVLTSKYVSVRESAPAGTPVVVYGASWCKPCDLAVSYLTARRIPYVKRDIEEDEGAGTELKALVAHAGLRERKVGIPVLDVRGTIISGFDACVVDWAWDRP